MKVIAIVGMSGSGKSEVTRLFKKKGFERIRFGDITDEEVLKRNLELKEENERQVREQIRAEHGMAAYAKLNIPKIESALKQSNVIIDGLYSWEEYKLLKEKYGDDLVVIAIFSSPKTRQSRLARRPIRPLTNEETLSRDSSEIENLHKAGPIAMANFTIQNEASMKDLLQEAERIIAELI